MKLPRHATIVEKKLHRPVPLVAAALAAGIALTACSASEAGGDNSASAAAQSAEACVVFSYGTLRDDVRNPVPRTAQAILRLLPVAYELQYGQDVPVELTTELSAGVDPGTQLPRTVDELGKQIDEMLQAQHPGLGNGGPVADDRVSLCYVFDVARETVQVGPGSYVLPFTYPDGVGREPVTPALIQAGTTARG